MPERLAVLLQLGLRCLLFLRQTGDNLDLLRIELMLVVHLEVDVGDDERPHLFAKPVRVEMTLPSRQPPTPTPPASHDYAYLEGHPSFHLIREYFRDCLVEVRQDAHGQLRLDTAATDQVVQGICERHSDATSY